MEEEIFITSKEACGSVMGEGKQNVPDDIHSSILCMVAGYKDVYMGSSKALENLNEHEKSLIYSGTIYKEIINDRIGYNLILYTAQGKKNALLLIKYLRCPKKKNQNHYLVGFLLGYDLKDIEYFYKRSFSQEQLEIDKRAAEEFISQN